MAADRSIRPSDSKDPRLDVPTEGPHDFKSRAIDDKYPPSEGPHDFKSRASDSKDPLSPIPDEVKSPPASTSSRQLLEEEKEEKAIALAIPLIHKEREDIANVLNTITLLAKENNFTLKSAVSLMAACNKLVEILNTIITNKERELIAEVKAAEIEIEKMEAAEIKAATTEAVPEIKAEKIKAAQTRAEEAKTAKIKEIKKKAAEVDQNILYSAMKRYFFSEPENLKISPQLAHIWYVIANQPIVTGLHAGDEFYSKGRKVLGFILSNATNVHASLQELFPTEAILAESNRLRSTIDGKEKAKLRATLQNRYKNEYSIWKKDKEKSLVEKYQEQFDAWKIREEKSIISMDTAPEQFIAAERNNLDIDSSILSFDTFILSARIKDKDIETFRNLPEELDTVLLKRYRKQHDTYKRTTGNPKDFLSFLKNTPDLKHDRDVLFYLETTAQIKELDHQFSKMEIKRDSNVKRPDYQHIITQLPHALRVLKNKKENGPMIIACLKLEILCLIDTLRLLNVAQPNKTLINNLITAIVTELNQINDATKQTEAPNIAKKLMLKINGLLKSPELRADLKREKYDFTDLSTIVRKQEQRVNYLVSNDLFNSLPSLEKKITAKAGQVISKQLYLTTLCSLRRVTPDERKKSADERMELAKYLINQGPRGHLLGRKRNTFRGLFSHPSYTLETKSLYIAVYLLIDGTDREKVEWMRAKGMNDASKIENARTQAPKLMAAASRGPSFRRASR